MLVATPNAYADVELGSPFSDNMVLQRGMKVPVWGWATPGEKVTVRFAEQTLSTVADINGHWNVALEPLEANAKPGLLRVEGKTKLKLRNILVGEVWICSGQSNMEWPVSHVFEAESVMENAHDPLLRIFDVKGHLVAPMPKERCPGKWQVSDKKTVPTFSAVAYFFGKALREKLKVPVGLIGSNWGGTRIELWTSLDGFKSVPSLKSFVAQVEARDPIHLWGKKRSAKFVSEMAKWVKRATASIDKGRPLPKVPVAGVDIKVGQGSASAIYNAMVHPLVPFAMRGAIWYQGEGNGNEGITYYHKKRALVQGWRKLFNPDLAFYWVQLANYSHHRNAITVLPKSTPEGGDGWAKLREAQQKALDLPHTGMAVIIEIGNPRDIHPQNKQDVGDRLARWALHQTYKQKQIVPSGPLYKNFTVKDSRLRLRFNHIGSGLMVGNKKGLAPVKEVTEGTLTNFSIAGKDKKWYWAKATIAGKTVLLSSSDVPAPVAARYCYTMNPVGANLYNKEGLPASPFRTDDW